MRRPKLYLRAFVLPRCKGAPPAARLAVPDAPRAHLALKVAAAKRRFRPHAATCRILCVCCAAVTADVESLLGVARRPRHPLGALVSGLGIEFFWITGPGRPRRSDTRFPAPGLLAGARDADSDPAFVRAEPTPAGPATVCRAGRRGRARKSGRGRGRRGGRREKRISFRGQSREEGAVKRGGGRSFSALKRRCRTPRPSLHDQPAHACREGVAKAG